MGKNLSNKYGQKLIYSAKKSTADAIETASKRAIQKTEEATGDLIGNKIADKITSVSKSLQKNWTLKNYHMTKLRHQKEDTYLQKKGNKLFMN